MKYGMPMVCGDTDNYFEVEIAEELARDFTENLIYHNVTVEGGHYCGFQFYVSERYEGEFDLDTSSKYCITNDEAHYYFDKCRSLAIREADREKRKIKKWLENLASAYGYDILVCVGVFSNGEAVYEKVTPRATLKAIANDLI